jgi:hypothetical protein
MRWVELQQPRQEAFSTLAPLLLLLQLLPTTTRTTATG